jgi:hypothetical protein
MVLSETFSREKTPYVVLPVPSLFVAIPPFPKLSRPLTYPFYYIQLQMDVLPLQSQQQFNYNNSLPGPPGEDDATSQDTRTATNNGAEKANVWNDGSIWGTQPPLDPSLLDIAKIAVLTRKIFGTDDMSLFIPKVLLTVSPTPCHT